MGLGHDDERFRPGRVLGPYQLVTEIGAGGMATVWAARLHGGAPIVALKILFPDLAEDPLFQQMFLDEARVASRVRHPNVCATQELAAYDGVLMLVMEYLDGSSLVRVFRPEAGDDAPRVPIPYRLAARIIADAAAGLHAAHETRGENGRPLNVVHRDVSPHNVLITSDGRVKLTDFGVAKALGQKNMTVAGQLKGKLAYMSPEQLVSGAPIDRRSDVFGLGCVLYEVTTGTKPFKGEHDPQLMAAIMVGSYAPPSEVKRDYPPELEVIVARALANDVRLRYASADELRLALEGWLSASGPEIGAREVSALLYQRCGPEVQGRARTLGTDRISSPSFPPRISSPSFDVSRSGATVPPGVEERSEPEGYSALGLLGAALVGSALGIGVLALIRDVRREENRTTPPPAVVASGLPPIPSLISTGGGTPSSEPPPAPDVIRFRPVPATATLVVDGKTTAGPAVPRPRDGATTTVLVHADDYQDTLVLVDQATSDVVDVVLTPLAATSVQAPKPKPKPAPKPGSTEPVTPPNPYGE